MGVAMAGGTPVVFPAIAVCDGIAMGHTGMKYSLVTRELIADSTECMAKAHQFDALVMVPNCDKNVPGLLMAAARINVPTVFVSGGPMLAGHVDGRKRSLSSMFEAVGAQAAGNITLDELKNDYHKLQIVLESGKDMYLLEKELNILSHQIMGRVHTLIVMGEYEKIEEIVSKYDPIINEALSLSLEEIFLYTMKGEYDEFI